MGFYLKYKPVLLFAFLSVFFTAPGQTFFIALFVPHIFADQTGSLVSFSGFYSAATLAASLFLNPIGRMIDTVSIRTMVLFNGLCFAAGAAGLALTADNQIGLFISFFLLRLFGQGVFVLTANTLLARLFTSNRGKAGSILSLGYPVSEMAYPPLALYLLSLFNYSRVYLILGAATLSAYVLASLLLLKWSNLPDDGGAYPDEDESVAGRSFDFPLQNYTLGMCFKDVRFYLLLAAASLPPVVMTAYFFHQQHLFTMRSLTPADIARAMVSYAVCKAAGSLYMGRVVDRVGPIMPYTLVIALLGIGPLFLAFGHHRPVFSMIYLGIMGAALGFSAPVSAVIWPRLYGVNHLGSIKGFVGTFRNGLTALGPVGLAVAIERNPKSDLTSTIITVCAVTLVMALIPALIARLSPGQFEGRL